MKVILTFSMCLYIEFSDGTCTVAKTTFEDAHEFYEIEKDLTDTCNNFTGAIAKEYKKDLLSWKFIDNEEYQKIYASLNKLGSDVISITEKAKPTNFELITKNPETFFEWINKIYCPDKYCGECERPCPYFSLEEEKYLNDIYGDGYEKFFAWLKSEAAV